MYSEADLDAAVAAGAISAEAAEALRGFMAARRAAPAADEEHFRLLTGFNDIFVSIAATLLLIAVGWLAGTAMPAAGIAAGALKGGLAIAAVSWGLAEYFTRRRRMALPSILLLASFAAGMFATGVAMVFELLRAGLPVIGAAPFDAAHPLAFPPAALVSGAVLAVAGAVAHWLRFRVPITVAVGACAAVAGVVTLLTALMPGLATLSRPLVFLGGLSLFALAMRWDISDRARTTRRSDVAFWLHLSAAPLIAHPTFTLLGLLGPGSGSHGTADLGRAGIAVVLYGVLTLVALVVDRRALLVSALIYVLFAISALMRAAGALSVSLALTALVVGSALLLLSAFWHKTRRIALTAMPDCVRMRVPAA